MNEQDLLSYNDILKLTVPFLLSLILFWAKHFYDNYRERINKNNHLWKGIKEEFDNCHKGKTALDETLSYLKKDTIIFFGLDIPHTLTDYSKRLAELESEKSYLYSDYASKVEIVRKGHSSLQSLLKQAIFQDLGNDKTGDRMKRAIESQVTALKGDLIKLSEAELLLMKHIRKKYQKKGEQDIRLLENILNHTKNMK
ncbi:MAG: hypothetical protein Wins2KO_32310 [Winogradskyella sp.]